ncbi:MAG: hypothetical protein IKQ10_04620 [Oscillospiraceae bacterium]|nr:hypothetical protein [Oscillospiraceae bacterium]
MKRSAAAWLLCAVLMFSAGCGLRSTGSAPAETAAPTAEPTAAPAPTPYISPSPTPVPTPTPTPDPTVYWQRGDKKDTYTLFAGTSGGAAALRDWLLGEGARRAALAVPESEETPIFELEVTPGDDADIAAAVDETRLIRFAVDRRILESGLLEAVLPDFEREYGYTVEVFTGDPADVKSWTRSRDADLVLLSGAEAKAVERKGFNTVVAYISTVYTIAE